MSRLIWTGRGSRWQAGEYLIELAAPCHWVLTAPRPDDDDSQISVLPTVLATSGSLKALKAEADSIEEAAVLGRRRRRLTTVLALALAVVSLATTWDGIWVPIPIIVASLVMVWALAAMVETFVPRPWDHVRGRSQ